MGMVRVVLVALPVVDADQRLLGIITESDIFRRVVAEWGEEEE